MTLLRTLLVTSLVVLTACTKETTTVAPDPAGTLTGRLTLLGAPVEGATVTLSGTTTTTTDADGVYSFTGVEGGVYSLGFAATGAVGDTIPEVYYSPDTGGMVPTDYSYDALYRLGTFDLQGATRLTSLNLRAPARSVTLPPMLSPDGQLYAYGVSNELGRTSLYVGSTAGGAPVLVTDDAYPALSTHFRFSPDSSLITFVRYNTTVTYATAYELWAAPIAPGPTVGTLARIHDFYPYSQMEFSPHTSATAPKSIYLIAYDTVLATYVLVEQNVNGGSVNEWPGVSSFWLSKQRKSVIFYQALPDDADADTTPQYRLVSVAATGASVGTTVVTYEGGATNPYALTVTWHGFSPDESRFAYTLSAIGAGGTATLGLKSALSAFATPILMEAVAAGTTPTCVTWSPAGDRLAWIHAGLLRTSVANTNSPASYTASPSANVCPTFTSDGQVWLAYDLGGGLIELATAPANASAPPTMFRQTASLRSFHGGATAAAWIEGSTAPYDLYARNLTSAATLVDQADGLVLWAPSGAGGLYRKLAAPYTSYAYSLHGLALGGATPTSRLITERPTSYTASPADQSKILVSELEEGSTTQTLAIVDTATAATRRVLRNALPGLARIQDVGATPAPRIIAARTSSPLPFEFQDGVYVADF